MEENNTHMFENENEPQKPSQTVTGSTDSGAPQTTASYEEPTAVKTGSTEPQIDPQAASTSSVHYGNDATYGGSNPYGAQTGNPYSAQGQTNPYGTQTGNPYGAQGQTNPYGTQTGNPYGAQGQQNPYGQPNPYGNMPYGQPQGKKDGLGFGIASLCCGVAALILFCTCINIPLAIASIIFGLIQLIGYKDKLLAGIGIACAVLSIVFMIIAFGVIGSLSLDMSDNGYGSGYEQYFEEYLEQMEDGSF